MSIENTFELLIENFKKIDPSQNRQENISEEIKNGYKLSRYILDVLTPALREHIINENKLNGLLIKMKDKYQNRSAKDYHLSNCFRILEQG